MSSDDSTIAASRSFNSSVRRRSVTSRKTRTTPAIRPGHRRWGGAVVDRRLPAVPSDQHRVVGQPDDAPLASTFRTGFSPAAGPLIEDVEDLLQGPPYRPGAPSP